MVALNAYLWLLQDTTGVVAGSYSGVNPAVAVVVGVALGGRASAPEELERPGPGRGGGPGGGGDG